MIVIPFWKLLNKILRYFCRLCYRRRYCCTKKSGNHSTRTLFSLSLTRGYWFESSFFGVDGFLVFLSCAVIIELCHGLTIHVCLLSDKDLWNSLVRGATGRMQCWGIKEDKSWSSILCVQVPVVSFVLCHSPTIPLQLISEIHAKCWWGI